MLRTQQTSSWNVVLPPSLLSAVYLLLRSVLKCNLRSSHDPSYRLIRFALSRFISWVNWASWRLLILAVTQQLLLWPTDKRRASITIQNDKKNVFPFNVRSKCEVKEAHVTALGRQQLWVRDLLLVTSMMFFYSKHSRPSTNEARQ